MRYLLSLSLLLLALTANARQIKSDEALTAAQDFFNNSTVEHSRAPRAIRARALNATQPEDTAPYYIFNASDNNGFVIISGDDRVTKVLGYSDKGNFDVNNMPPQLSAMLDQFAEGLTKLSGSTTDQSWNAPSRAASADGGVLLETANWGQGYPYNALCPTLNGTKCPTGCCATAMAIIMDYHQWPQSGRGCRNYGSDGQYHNINFDEYPFNWQLVHKKNSPYDETVSDELSKIFYAAAVSVITQFDTFESTAISLGIAQSLNYYFKYGDCQYIMKNFHTDDEWVGILKEQINKSLPVICGGVGSASHAFICDGYNSNGDFHINWGWEGQYNGYYSFTLMNPGDNSFSNYIWAIVDIQPSNEDEEPSPLWLSQYGLSIDVENIVKGEPFNTRSMQVGDNLMLNNAFVGEAALCLVDYLDNIVEVIKTIPMDHSINGSPLSILRFTDCVVKSEILPNYRLKLYSRNSESYKWKPIHGSVDCASEIPVFNNSLRFTPLTWDIPSNVYLQTELDEYANSAYWDADYFVRLYFPYEEMLTVYVNDQVLQPSHFHSKYCPFPQVDYYFYNTLSINVRFDESYKEGIVLKVKTTPISSLQDESLYIEEPNKIQNQLQSIGNPLQLGTLHIRGNISQQDITYLLTNYPNIKYLDLSESLYFTNDGVPCSTIENGLFNICLNLEDLSLPKNIKHIEGGSIQRCYRLNTLRLPSSVETVDVDALLQCYYLHHVIFRGDLLPNGLLDAILNSHITGEEYWYDPIYGGGYCTVYLNANNYNTYCSNNNYGKSIKFACLDIQSPISINDGMITYSNFGDEIYVGCLLINDQSQRVSLTGKVTFRESINGIPVKYILSHSFGDHHEITDLIFSNGLEEIGECSFMNCGVENMDLPATMQRIYRYAFQNCDKIKNIYVRTKIPFVLADDAFPESAFNAKLYVPYGTKDLYRYADVWRNFNNIEEFDSSGISDVMVDESNQKVLIYNLQGIKVFEGNATSKPTLPSGIYLRRVGNKVVKVVV